MPLPQAALRKLLGIAFAATLTACASYSGSGLVSGRSTDAEARALMGTPFAVHQAGPGKDFAYSLEYSRGPEGRHTYMARFDAGGRLVRIDQVIGPSSVKEIRPGTSSKEDVRKILGRPGRVSFPRLQKGEAWEYFGFDHARKVILHVAFDANGIATSAGMAIDPIEDDRANFW